MKILALTGAAAGIGRGIALHFAREGYALSLADVDTGAAAQTLRELRGAGANARFFETDISRPEDVTRWLDGTVEAFGVPTALVNNAGISHGAPFLDLAVEDFDRVVAVNLRGTFLCTQAFARAMAARRVSGAIVNISSTRAFMSEPDTEAYSATKGGIFALTHATAMSLAEHRIRLNCVSPGWIETPRVPAKTEQDQKQHPVGRVGTPEDVAQACLYLIEHAPFVTGQNLIVDGGMSVKMIYAE